MFAMTPEKTGYLDVIGPQIGIESSAYEYVLTKGITPSKDFMLGGGQTYTFSDPFESSLSVALHDLQHMLAQTVEIRHGHHYGAVVSQRWKFSVFVSHVNRSGGDFHIKQNLVEHGFGIADALLRTVDHQQIRCFFASDGIGCRNGFVSIQIRDVEPRDTVMHAQAFHQQHQCDGHEHGPHFDQTLPAESFPLGQHV